MKRALLLASVLTLAAAACATAALEPFTMPWNDASAGVTNLQPWQAEEAGASGWVRTTPEGHYELDGRRIRFLGVNIGAGDAFPSQDRARAHAARLARFGFNAVRFHHLEAPWERSSVLLDYASGNSRTLSAERLDRLHAFVSQLAAHGIYSNINLLVSREFQAGDGLGAEITQLGWKDQHILGFFHDGAFELHKEHATKLLTAPNPHRGDRSLANDPAVAFVEIMNENGLLQKWYEGVLDALPPPYARALESKWNAWLRVQYGGTAALLKGWAAVDEPLGSTLLTNGSFADAANSWNLETHSGAVASATGTHDFNGSPSLRVAVTAGGSAGWHVQLTQNSVNVIAGRIYTLSFWVRAAATTPLWLGLTHTGPDDYSSVGAGVRTNAGTTWQQHTWTFVAPATETLRVVMNGFGDRTATVTLADVRLQPGGKLGGIPDGASLEGGNVPIVRRNSGASAPTTEQSRDWTRFVLDAERQYWSAMKQHIKGTLGYRGIVWGTIISNSPPNAQRDLDAMDSHAYWQHPQFAAGSDWDPEQWTVANVSMVNSVENNALTGMFRQRVHGYPHNATEYQHSSPNTYASEGPVLGAAYAALQDWDSLWMFSYLTGTSEFVTGYFDHGGHPGKMANNLLAAALFRRGDVAPGRREYVMPMKPEREADLAHSVGGPWSIADGAHLGVPGKLGAESRLALSIGTDAAGLPQAPSAAPGSRTTSDTGQLAWDVSVTNKGVVTIDTPRTKAVVGFTAGRSFDLGGVTFAPGATRQDWCTLGLVVLDGRGINDAAGARGVIVATGDQENTGQVWKDSTRTSVGTRWGSAPVLIEVVPATVTLPVDPARVSVWALDGKGQRTTPVVVRAASGQARFDLGQSGATVWYEFEVAATQPEVPRVLQAPSTRVVSPGANVWLSVDIAGNPKPSLQWFRNGTAIPGATAAELHVPSASAASAGAYHVLATNSAGTVETPTFTLALTGSPEPSRSRLVNVSTRGPVGTGDEVMIAGCVVDGQRDLLIRAIGPRLNQVWQLAGVLPDPEISVYRDGAVVRENDNWDPVEVKALADGLGAFDLGASSKEAAALLAANTGVYSTIVRGAHDGTGLALVEVYDAGVGGGRIMNLSTRGRAGPGDQALVVGFVVRGDVPKRVLLRGVGPGLRTIAPALGNLVADPQLTLYRMVGGMPYQAARNDDWADGTGAGLAATASRVGAFPLATLSFDSALDVWLEPGDYTAVMEPKSGAGLGLVEIYAVD